LSLHERLWRDRRISGSEAARRAYVRRKYDRLHLAKILQSAGLISETLREFGVQMLQNENRWIDHFGEKIKVSGVTEIYSSKILNKELNDLLSESDNESLSLLFAHQASDRLIEESLLNGVNHIYGAHTHGGQLRIPIFFYPATAVREETKYVNGHWLIDGMLLNVNSGLGFTLSPVRYNAPAQISVIRLSSE